MKTLRIPLIILFTVIATNTFAQQNKRDENYGRTLNLGLGIGYYGYVGYSTPVFHADYEIMVARSFTLAPFINVFSYKEYTYWGNPNHPYRNYYYHETVMPVGVKGSYYFDRLLGAGPDWDFYLAGSLGVEIRKTVWDDGYYGDRVVDHSSSPLFIDLHIGTEYHFNKKVGLFLDLSTGVSTLGLGFHL